jgi:hypothetical protein
MVADMDKETRAAINAIRLEIDEMRENDLSFALAKEVDALWQALDLLGQKLFPLMDGKTAANIILALENLEVEWRQKRLPVDSSIFRAIQGWRGVLETVAAVGDLLDPGKGAQESLARGRRSRLYDALSHERRLRGESPDAPDSQPQSGPSHPEQSGEPTPPGERQDETDQESS